MDVSLEGKVALVTGAANGIGINVVARHPSPVPRERQGDPAADVRTRPGHQRNLALERDVHEAQTRPSMITLLTWV